LLIKVIQFASGSIKGNEKVGTDNLIMPIKIALDLRWDLLNIKGSNKIITDPKGTRKRSIGQVPNSPNIFQTK
jgi:hypothetical protein